MTVIIVDNNSKYTAALLKTLRAYKTECINYQDLPYKNLTWLQALAYSEDGVEILKHWRKPIYGLQFHPEESGFAGQQVLHEILAAVRNNTL